MAIKEHPHCDKINELTEAFFQEIVPLIMDVPDKSKSLISFLNTCNAAILPMAALHGEIGNQPGLDVKRRMVVMGNQSVNMALKGLERSGKMKSVEGMDELRQLMESIGGDDDDKE
jgi:hypothetical protein